MQTGISLKARHFKQYKEIFNLLFRLWKGSQAAPEHNGNGQPRVESTTELEQMLVLADDSKEQELSLETNTVLSELKRLGPTYIRLAQLMALRNNLLPVQYLDALAELGEHDPALSFSEVREIVEAETGRSINDTFLIFDPEPLAVSVFDQAHHAVTFDKTEVIVKIQKPNLKEQVSDDLEAIDEVARIYDRYSGPDEELEIHETLGVFRKAILADLDYRLEAHNLRAMRSYLKEMKLILVPKPIDRLSSANMLTVEFIQGQPLTEASLVGLLRTERNRLAEEIFHAYLQQFLIDGFVHSDPSPEKLLLTKEGKIALVNLGVVDRIAPSMQAKLIQLLLAIIEGQAEQAANLLVKLSTRRRNFDEEKFRKAIAELVLVHRDIALEKSQMGSIFRGILQASTLCGATLPFEVTELGQTLLKLEQVARFLNPNFDSHSFTGKIVSRIMRRHIIEALSPAHVFHTVVEAVEFVEHLPQQISQILESLANNELKVTVHTIDEQVLISGFQKIANRITVGLVLAALIIGASMLMRVPSTFSILGYPGLAMLCFIAAAGCGFALVIEVLFSDRKQH